MSITRSLYFTLGGVFYALGWECLGRTLSGKAHQNCGALSNGWLHRHTGQALGRENEHTIQPNGGGGNKGGGGSVIGSSFVAKAPADGYTLLLVAADLAINESLVPDKLNYNASKDFAGVSLCAWSPLAMVVTPKLGVQKFSEFMEMARKNPNSINFASGGNGTGAHLALELFKSKSKLSIVHVPYKGNGPALTDLLGGQVSGMFLPYALAKPHIETHKLIILGTPGARRSTAMPQIPTLAEQGITGLDVQPWFGVVAPKLTPASTLETLNKEITTIMNSNDVRAKLKELGAEGTSSSPKEFDLFISDEIKRWAQVVSDSGATAD